MCLFCEVCSSWVAFFYPVCLFAFSTFLFLFLLFFLFFFLCSFQFRSRFFNVYDAFFCGAFLVRCLSLVYFLTGLVFILFCFFVFFRLYLLFPVISWPL